MSHDIQTNLDKKELRKFAFAFAIMISLVFGLFFPWILNHPLPKNPFYISAFFIFWAMSHPQSLKYPYIYWMKFAKILGFINTKIILSLTFFILFFPIAIALKLLKKDPMHRKFEKEKKSYRINKKPIIIKNMEGPY